MAVSSETVICNLAISHLGSGKTIANVETEKSQEAASCRIFFDLARDATLEDFPWSFATKIMALDLIEEDPNDEYDFSYRYPSNALKFIKIQSGIRNDNRQTRVTYKIGYDSTGKIIFTDQDDAIGEYIIRVSDVALYTQSFCIALSYRLAAFIAPQIVGVANAASASKLMLDLYQMSLTRAQANNLNEQQPDDTSVGEFIESR